MPDQAEIENKVKQIIVDELGADENEVTPNARFIDDLGADSLDTVELVMRFEEEFGIEIPDEDAEKIQSVRDAYPTSSHLNIVKRPRRVAIKDCATRRVAFASDEKFRCVVVRSRSRACDSRACPLAVTARAIPRREEQ